MTIEEIEHKIACGELSAAQVFTQMRQFICRSALELAAPDLYEALECALGLMAEIRVPSNHSVVTRGLQALAKARGE